MKITIELNPKLDDSHVLLIYRIIAACEFPFSDDDAKVYAEDLIESLILLRDVCSGYVGEVTNEDTEYFDKYFGADSYKAKFANQFLRLKE